MSARKTCAVDGCERPVTRNRLCYRCNRERAHEIHGCKHPACTNDVWREDYCSWHDHGIDWAAGDWYDEVAVQRVWSGRPDIARLPTELEVRELIARADRTGTSYNLLADRLGITHQAFERWRNALAQLDSLRLDVDELVTCGGETQ